MTGVALILVSQVFGDTLRWYDPETAGWDGIGFTSSGLMQWAVIFPINSNLDGRTVHSGRVHIYLEPGDSAFAPGTLKVCRGVLDSPTVVLSYGTFYATGWGFYEVPFGDTIVLNQGDLIWLWCCQAHTVSQHPASVDSGPAVPNYGDLVWGDGSEYWYELRDFGLNYNWVMELVLTPTDVQEGPAKPEGKLTLLPAPGGFWITGYEGPTQIYDPAGRLVLSKEIKGKTLISPLRPGVYFVVAGKEKARIAI